MLRSHPLHSIMHESICLSRRGTNLMPSLIEFLKAKGSEEEEKRSNLIGVLREINNALQVHRALLPTSLLCLTRAKFCTVPMVQAKLSLASAYLPSIQHQGI